jgi:hypothetical protein
MYEDGSVGVTRRGTSEKFPSIACRHSGTARTTASTASRCTGQVHPKEGSATCNGAFSDVGSRCRGVYAVQHSTFVYRARPVVLQTEARAPVTGPPLHDLTLPSWHGTWLYLSVPDQGEQVSSLPSSTTWRCCAAIHGAVAGAIDSNLGAKLLNGLTNASRPYTPLHHSITASLHHSPELFDINKRHTIMHPGRRRGT